MMAIIDEHFGANNVTVTLRYVSGSVHNHEIYTIMLLVYVPFDQEFQNH